MSDFIFFSLGRTGSTIIKEAVFCHRDLSYFSSYQQKYPSVLAVNYIRYLFDNKFYRLLGVKKQLNTTPGYNRLLFRSSEAYDVWDNLLGGEFSFSRSFCDETDLSRITRNHFASFVKSVQRIQGKDHFAAKVTGPSRLLLLDQLFENVKYVRVTRDILPTIHSFLKVKFWRDRSIEELWWTGAYTDDEIIEYNEYKHNPLYSTSFQLRKILSQTQFEIELLKPDIFTIKYENFVSNPEDILTKTLEWMGLSLDENCFNYLDSNKVVNRNVNYNKYYSDADIEWLMLFFKNYI